MLKYFFLLILFYSCDSVTSPKIKEDPGDNNTHFEYLINLKGVNTGHYFDVCTLKWNQYPNENFQFYILKNDEETMDTINQKQDTIFIAQLNPETFKKIYIEVVSDTIRTDEIEIYTRPIKPITNLNAAANADSWFSTLNWSPSNEISSRFEKYNIYRSDINANNFILINEINNQTDSSYIDTITTWGYEYYYKIDTQTIEGYSRRSIIESNIVSNTQNNQISLSTINNQYNQITLSWAHDLNEQEFYAIEIWRTDIQTIDPLEDYLLATITDYNKNSLEDSYEVGNGISWFYKLKLIDRFGNISYSSIISGNSLP